MRAVPSFFVTTRPTRRSKRRCLEIAGRLVRKLPASSPTVCLRWRNRPRISRRVGSAIARENASRPFGFKTTHIRILPQPQRTHLVTGRLRSVKRQIEARHATAGVCDRRNEVQGSVLRASKPEPPVSALPPKADIGTQACDVCFVPKADVSRCSKRLVRTLID